MTKDAFLIRTRSGPATVTGYTFQHGGIPVGYFRSGPAWYAVDLKTGLGLFGETVQFRTLKEAQETVTSYARSRQWRAAQIYREAVTSHINPDISPRYTLWTVHTGETA